MNTMLTWKALTEAVNKIPTTENFINKLVFKKEKKVDADTVELEIKIGNKKLAPFVSRLEGGKVVQKLSKKGATVKIPKIRIKKPFTAEELFTEHSPAQNAYVVGGSIITEQRKAIAEELQDLKDRIERRIEWMSAKALTGILSYSDETVEFEIDFQMPATHKPVLAGGAIFGGADGTNIVVKLREWSRLIQRKTGKNPDTMLIGSNAFDALIADTEVKAILDNRNVNAGSLDLSGNRYRGSLLGMKIYEVTDQYQDEAGADQDMIDPDALVLINTKGDNRTFLAPIKDRATGSKVVKAKYFAKQWDEQDPSAMWMLAESNPLPALLEPESVVYAVVV